MEVPEELRISSNRLRLLLALVKGSGQDIQSEIESLTPSDKKLLTSLPEVSHLPLKREQQILQTLLRKNSAIEFLREAGYESLNSVFSTNMSEERAATSLEEQLFLVPSYFITFSPHIQLVVKKSSENNLFYFTLSPWKGTSLIAGDFYFFLGFLDYLFHFFSITPSPPEITTLSFPATEKLSSDFKNLPVTLSPETEIVFAFPDLSDGKTVNVENKINPRDAYIQSVLERTQQLIRDKRDLSTAVEYLNIANDQLEKEMRANKKELLMARNIQKGFVPSRLPDWKGLRFWVKFFPLVEVSGDFYDYIPLGGHKLGLYVADVSGHGVPAALITAIGKLSFSNHRLDSPAETFAKVNLDMLQYVKREGYLTSFYMIIDSDYQITYSAAAAPPAIIHRAATGEIEELESKGTILGMFPDANELLKDSSTYLHPGDKIFIYTDGLIESENIHGESFGVPKLIEEIKKTRGLDVQESSERIEEAWRKHILGRDPSDDFTMLTVMLSEQTDEFNELLSKARKAQSQKQYSEAAGMLEKAVEIFPHHPNTLFSYGKVLAQQGEYSKAVEVLELYNSLKPYNADSYTILAYCSFRQGLFDRARDELKSSLSLRSENPVALYNLIQVNLKLGLTEEVQKAFDQLVTIRPRWKRIETLKKLLELSPS